ncbi:MAG: flagellar hook capping protein [Lachnospiraceae bacterium]|nr:flagellar hook capping protein [Lachnospiraceae bacterium]
MALIQEVKDGKIVESATTTSSTDKKNNSDMGKEDFLKLLVAQMKYQDPLQPQENTEYVTQLATFSQVEAMTNMSGTMSQMEANNLVGKIVIMKPTNSVTGETTTVTGTVDYVMHEGNKVYLSINDSLYNLDDLDTVTNEDYYIASTLSDTVESYINELPTLDNATLANKEEVDYIRKIYDTMNDYQKSFVDNDLLSKFINIENKLKALQSLQDLVDSQGSGETTETTENTESTDTTQSS